ncbi:MAG: flagellar hook-length control protein FliK [Pseudomonadota bacterium]
MVLPTLPLSPTVAVTVSDRRSLRQLAESGQLKTWQAGAILDVVVNRRDGNLLVLTSKQGPISLPVPADRPFPPGTALQLQILALAPLQVQLRPASPLASPAAPSTSTGLLSVASASAVLAGTAAASAGPAGTRPALPAATLAAPPEPEPVLRLLQEHLRNVLKPGLSEATPSRQAALTQPLVEWLSRVSNWQSPAELESIPANSLPALARQLLQSLPSADQAGEPDALEPLLRQVLFGQPPAAASANAARPTDNDWLGALLKLLQAASAAAAQAGKTAAAALPAGPNPAMTSSAALVNKSADRPGAEPPSQGATLPLPGDDVLEELASLLGRQQQQWLNNVQQDGRQQPLYAELLLRQQERLDRVEISVRADRDTDAEAASATLHHVVRLRFDLPGLGICQFLLDLRQDDLQLHFYSEDAGAAAAFEQHLDWLARQLAADGVQLSSAASHTVAQLPSLQPTAERGLHVRV